MNRNDHCRIQWYTRWLAYLRSETLPLDPWAGTERLLIERDYQERRIQARKWVAKRKAERGNVVPLRKILKGVSKL